MEQLTFSFGSIIGFQEGSFYLIHQLLFDKSIGGSLQKI